MAKAKTHIGSWRRVMRRQKNPARDAVLTSQLHAILSDPRRWPKSWPIIRVDIRMLR